MKNKILIFIGLLLFSSFVCGQCVEYTSQKVVYGDNFKQYACVNLVNSSTNLMVNCLDCWGVSYVYDGNNLVAYRNMTSSIVGIFNFVANSDFIINKTYFVRTYFYSSMYGNGSVDSDFVVIPRNGLFSSVTSSVSSLTGGIYDDFINALNGIIKGFTDTLMNVLNEYHITEILGYLSDFIIGILVFFKDIVLLIVNILGLIFKFIVSPVSFVNDIVKPFLLSLIWKLINYSIGWTVFVEVVVIGYSFIYSRENGRVNVFKCLEKFFYGNVKVIKWYAIIVIFSFKAMIELFILGLNFIVMIYHAVKTIRTPVPVPGS